MLRKMLLGLAVLAVIGCSSKPDVSKLKEGMTESEVIAVLGKPDKEEGVPTMPMKSLSYTSMDPPVILMIVDGKLKSALSGGKSLLGK